MNAYRTITYGKWILAGEHAVLRGCPALAFPLTTRSLELEYRATGQPLDVEFAGDRGEELKLLFWGVLENAIGRIGREQPSGHFKLTSTLPVGAGLGASAALCGAVARWCASQGWIENDSIYEFARGLEDLFHGESSGVDLAVSLSSQGVRFVRGGARDRVAPRWWPRLYLSYCGSRGMTSDCVTKVKRLFETAPARATELDARMREAVESATEALTELDAAAGLPVLAHALSLGRSCFLEWDLCGGDLGAHMAKLDEAGALAVKPTGSGGGGYALSLWRDVPPAHLPLIPLPAP